jgi:hypothetical protein
MLEGAVGSSASVDFCSLLALAHVHSLCPSLAGKGHNILAVRVAHLQIIEVRAQLGYNSSSVMHSVQSIRHPPDAFLSAWQQDLVKRNIHGSSK